MKTPTYPIYTKNGFTVAKIISAEQAISVYTWPDGTTMLNKDLFVSVAEGYGEATQEEWQAALRNARAEAERFFDAEIIPTREEIESN